MAKYNDKELEITAEAFTDAIVKKLRELTYELEFEFDSDFDGEDVFRDFIVEKLKAYRDLGKGSQLNIVLDY